jgi:hypothetical protein
MFSREVSVRTPSGRLTPVWDYEDARKKYAASVVFYESGALRSVRLQEPCAVPSPLGKAVPAERISYFESGAVKRLFPLDGKISGFWTQRDEMKLARDVTVTFPWGGLTLPASCLSFFETGEIRSVTLWPGNSVTLPLPTGESVKGVSGFSLYRDGSLESVEPLSPARVRTPIGVMPAYDPEALRVCADNNSLKFDRAGNVSAVKALIVFEALLPGQDAGRDGQAPPVRLAPIVKRHPLDDGAKVHLPLCFEFKDRYFTVIRGVKDETPQRFPKGSKVTLSPYRPLRLVNVRLS